MFYERSTPMWKVSAINAEGKRINYTGYISMVKTSISSCCHFEFKITQTSVFLNFLKLFQMETGTYKYTKINVL